MKLSLKNVRVKQNATFKKKKKHQFCIPPNYGMLCLVGRSLNLPTHALTDSFSQPNVCQWRTFCREGKVSQDFFSESKCNPN